MAGFRDPLRPWPRSARGRGTCSNVAMPPLERTHKGILWAHIGLALALWAFAFAGAEGDTGWADLARVAITVLAVAYLAGVGVAWLAMRFAVAAPAVRTGVALLGPPVVFLLVLLLLRAG